MYFSVITHTRIPDVHMQICGLASNLMYLLTGSGSKVSTVDIVSGATTTVITNLVQALGCALDAGGSGDVILLDHTGSKLLVVPGTSIWPVSASTLSPIYTIPTSANRPAYAVAGNTGSSTFFVSIAGWSDVNYAICSGCTENPIVLKVVSGVSTNLTAAAPIGQLSSGSITNSDGSLFAMGLTLTSSGTLYVAGSPVGVAPFPNAASLTDITSTWFTNTPLAAWQTALLGRLPQWMPQAGSGQPLQAWCTSCADHLEGCISTNNNNNYSLYINQQAEF